MFKDVRVNQKSYTVELRDNYDAAILYEVLEDRQYNLLDPIIRQAKHAMIDVGGHLGFFPLYVRSLNGEVPVYTYEPYLENYQILKRNIKNNQLNKIFIHQSALSDQLGSALLQISEANQNHALSRPIDPTGQVQAVSTTTLARVISKYQLAQIDLVKMDCEGGEYAIIRSITADLAQVIKTIFIEYHAWVEGEDPRELEKNLQKLGYRIQRKGSRYSQDLGFILAQRE